MTQDSHQKENGSRDAIRPSHKLVILGSTGSVGVSSLDVAGRFSDRFQVVGLTAGRNVGRLAEQIEAFRPRAVAVVGKSEADALKKILNPAIPCDVFWGEQGIERVASLDEADTVVSAIVGAAGLKPTWAAVEAGKKIALANKETLVMAGAQVMARAKATGAVVLPVDSEHSAVFQSLCGGRPQELKRIILTASGGPFRDWDLASMAGVTPGQAVAHPNWNMGAKISVDSATLMNKGLEAIEARWLFELKWEQIDIQIHPQSIIHSMVEFVDGSVMAQLGLPDMRLPIAYALSYPKRLALDLPSLDLTQMGAMTFTQPDLKRFPCLGLALEAGRLGGTAPAALNAANEVAVQAFLDGRIGFTDIYRVVRKTLDQIDHTREIAGLEGIFEADRLARESAAALVSSF